MAVDVTTAGDAGAAGARRRGDDALIGWLLLAGLVAAGAALVFGGEINEFTRRVMMLVLVVSFVVAATNFASALGITGAVV